MFGGRVARIKPIIVCRINCLETAEPTEKFNRLQIIGRNLFEVFPDNPDEPDSDSVKNLTASLNIVLAEKVPHFMEIIKYDVPLPGGGFEKKYWKTVNSPIFDEN